MKHVLMEKKLEPATYTKTQLAMASSAAVLTPSNTTKLPKEP